MTISRVHHVAIICSDYTKSKRFYTEILRLPILSEIYRENRCSYKLDLALPDGVQIELFSFVGAPQRLSYPEACGLRHLAFEVVDLDRAVATLISRAVPVEEIRLDALTGKRFTFFVSAESRALVPPGRPARRTRSATPVRVTPKGACDARHRSPGAGPSQGAFPDAQDRPAGCA
jgi:glyoxylase I family protein